MRLMWCLALSALVAGCKDRPAANQSLDADGFDGVVRTDSTVPALEIDFAATGCPQYDLAASKCSGTVPLTVAFTPIGSSSVTRFLWDFGDGTPKSAEHAPTHTYVFPGVFTVSLVGAGSTGTVQRTHRNFVAANVAGLGGLCDVDAQCANGLRCYCGAGAACGDAFPRGLCTTECRAGVCSGGAICADLPTMKPDGGTTTEPTSLCLVACDSDADCATGLGCRTMLTSASGQAAWARGCFALTTLEVGAACRTASGTLSSSACVSGRCDDLGALGLCVSSCGGGLTCPPKTGCASFRDGRTLCLATCSDSSECGRDPLIGCEPAGAPGALGFTLAPRSASPPAPSSACAPKGCVVDDDCAPAGACRDGHCVRR